MKTGPDVPFAVGRKRDDSVFRDALDVVGTISIADKRSAATIEPEKTRTGRGEPHRVVLVFDAVLDSSGDSFPRVSLANIEPGQAIRRSIEDREAAVPPFKHVHDPEHARVIFAKEDRQDCRLDDLNPPNYSRRVPIELLDRAPIGYPEPTIAILSAHADIIAAQTRQIGRLVAKVHDTTRPSSVDSQMASVRS